MASQSPVWPFVWRIYDPDSTLVISSVGNPLPSWVTVSVEHAPPYTNVTFDGFPDVTDAGLTSGIIYRADDGINSAVDKEFSIKVNVPTSIEVRELLFVSQRGAEVEVPTLLTGFTTELLFLSQRGAEEEVPGLPPPLETELLFLSQRGATL